MELHISNETTVQVPLQARSISYTKKSYKTKSSSPSIPPPWYEYFLDPSPLLKHFQHITFTMTVWEVGEEESRERVRIGMIPPLRIPAAPPLMKFFTVFFFISKFLTVLSDTTCLNVGLSQWSLIFVRCFDSLMIEILISPPFLVFLLAALHCHWFPANKPL